MSTNYNVRKYKKRVYSGLPNKKRVAGQLKRHYGESCVSRNYIWGPHPKIANYVPEQTGATTGTPLETISSGPSKPLRTYARPTPIMRKEACFSLNNENSTPTSAPVSSSSCLVNWPLPDATVEQHQLQVEVMPRDDWSQLTGYRVVDIKHVIQWAFEIERHKTKCTGAIIIFEGEKRNGLQSTFHFKCMFCSKEWKYCSEANDKVNKSFVWGTVTAGSYYAQTEHVLSIMDIPTMTSATFQKKEMQLGDVWLEHLTEEITKAGEEEKSIAIAKGNIDDDGKPFVTVYVDGGWPKRCYGHNYNSASGMACIIGKETKKCLFLGVKNKYCFYCQYYEKAGINIPPHKCFKNFEGPSTSMEAAILVEGFQKSEDMHGIRYSAFIGDGDSSVFSQLKEKVNYGRSIRKIECKNHVVKNYSNALYKILSNTKLPLSGRNLLKPRLTQLTIVARKIIIHNANNPNNMRKDLKNGPLHVFGRHDNCLTYYCKYKAQCYGDQETPQAQDTDIVEKLKKEATTVWALIIAANENIISKAGRLSNETTNIAENFMSIINKFNCGKRINLCKGGSYQRRVCIAGLQHSTGYAWHNDAWRKSGPYSPGSHFKTFIRRREQSRLRQKTYIRRRLFAKHPKEQQPDKHYGPAAIDPVEDIDPIELKKMCSDKLPEFQKSSDEIKEIELATVGQHDNDLYNLHRSDRLTASQFGMVCKRRDSTPCHNHVKQILYKSNFSTKDTAYGHQNESVARTIFMETRNKVVRPAGLFIDEEYGFLGASPDGVIQEEEAIVEIKCFPSLARSAQRIESAAKDKKSFPLCYVADTLQMNKKHNYFYQVQGQLRVTKMKKCYFIGYISPMHPITVVEVYRDEEFISALVTKLKVFFENCILPEIILRRIPKNAKCLEPTKATKNVN